MSGNLSPNTKQREFVRLFICAFVCCSFVCLVVIPFACLCVGLFVCAYQSILFF